MFAYMIKLFWSKFGIVLWSILQTVWPQVRLLRSTLIEVHNVCLHDIIILEKILKCTEDIKSRQQLNTVLLNIFVWSDKNKNDYLIFVNENRYIWVCSRYDTLMQCQSSHKYFEIIYKIFIFQLKLPSFLDQTPTVQFWLPIFFHEWIL